MSEPLKEGAEPLKKGAEPLKEGAEPLKEGAEPLDLDDDVSSDVGAEVSLEDASNDVIEVTSLPAKTTEDAKSVTTSAACEYSRSNSVVNNYVPCIVPLLGVVLLPIIYRKLNVGSHCLP